MALLVASAPAQTASGTLEGRVFNATGGVALRNAVVSLEDLGRRTVTDDDGGYRIPGVPAGRVRVEVSYLGFLPQSATVEIAPGSAVTRDFELRPRAGDQTVRLGQFTVVADREMSAQAVSLNERRLKALAVIRRIAETEPLPLVFGQTALGDEVPPGGIHHDRCAANVGLVCGKIWKIRHDSVMNEAGPARPLIFRKRV
jgi:hypothetical protein